MKKSAILSAVILIMLIAGNTAFGQPAVKETRNVTAFTGVGFGVAGELTVKIGKDFSLVLEGDPKFLAEIETVVRNGKLLISHNSSRFFNNEKVNAYVTMPELQFLGLSGSGRATVKDQVKTARLGLSVSGSGKIYMSDIDADEMNCSISGSGDIIIEGTGDAGKGEISISGSGNYTGENMKIKSLRTAISGSGNCSCNVTESLSASISGSGNVTYSGNPRMDVRASGSGHVRSK